MPGDHDDAGANRAPSIGKGNHPVAIRYWIDRLLAREEGQGLAEYALILALIAVIAIAALVFLGTRISAILSSIGANI
jgi:pilus assembly protein Flp/PilA